MSLALIPNGGASTATGQFHGNFKNLFTCPNLRSLFNILHPSNTHITQTLQDFNSDSTSYICTTHNINAFFVKTDDASVVPWFQEITSVLLSIILQNNLFHQCTICIPHTNLLTPLKYFCLDIIFHSLPTSWTFYIQLYHVTNFGECISAHRYSFHIYQKPDKMGLFSH